MSAQWVGAASSAGFLAGTTISLWTRSITVPPAVALIAQFVILWPLLINSSALTMTEHAIFSFSVWTGAINGRLVCTAIHQKRFIGFGIAYTVSHSAGSALMTTVISVIGIGYAIGKSWIPFQIGGMLSSLAGCLVSFLSHIVAYKWLCKIKPEGSRIRRRVFIGVGFVQQIIILVFSGICDLFIDTPITLSVRFGIFVFITALSTLWAIRQHARRRRRNLRRMTTITTLADSSDETFENFLPSTDSESHDTSSSTSSGSSDDDFADSGYVTVSVHVTNVD